MAATATPTRAFDPALTRDRAGAAVAGSWYQTTLALAATSIVVGLQWDISWHMTIGRDTFWTPAHMAIYLGGVLAGLASGWLALRTTFGSDAEARAGSVRLWGFRAPLAAWVSIWGAIAMITSAPFDDWWHGAYGLDVAIISPPHAVLAAGFSTITIGAVLATLAAQNAADGWRRRWFGMLYAYSGGVYLLLTLVFLTEFSFPERQHTLEYFRASAIAYPFILVAIARAARIRWPATTAALFAVGLRLVMIWVLPLFEAQPMLAPIYRPLTHMVPPHFPDLLFVPAIAIDLLLRWSEGRDDWGRSLLLGVAFAATFIAVQWHMSEFLLSEGSHNAFFAGDRVFPFWDRPDPSDFEFSFSDWRNGIRVQLTPLSWSGGIAVALFAAASARLGLWMGSWMSQVRR